MSLAIPARAVARWAVLCGAVALVAAIVGAIAGATPLGIEAVAASDGSLAEASAILAANLRLAAIVGLAAWIATWPDRWRPPMLLIAAVPIALALVNALVVGVVLGSLGVRALMRAVPHAPLELAGFAAAFLALACALLGVLTARLAITLGGLCVVCLGTGAIVESFVSGGLG